MSKRAIRVPLTPAFLEQFTEWIMESFTESLTQEFSLARAPARPRIREQGAEEQGEALVTSSPHHK